MKWNVYFCILTVIEIDITGDKYVCKGIKFDTIQANK